MARNQKDKRRQGSTETTELGKVLHVCQGQLIVSLVADDVPYPNSPVLNSSSKTIGKVDEILGRLNDVYAAIKLNDENEVYKNGEMLFSYVDRFIPKKKFLPRSEVERKKEEMDSARSRASKNDNRAKDGRGGDKKFAGNRSGPKRDDRKPSGGWGNKRNDRREWSNGRSNGAKSREGTKNKGFSGRKSNKRD